MNWLHRLLHPHCESCLEEARENRHCLSCETLTQQLEIAQAEKKQLLNTILHPDKPEMREVETPQPIIPRNTPWGIKRAQMESKDREQAEANRLKAQREKEIKDAMPKESTEKLEIDLGVKNG